MTQPETSHHWVDGPGRAGREIVTTGLALPAPLLPPVDAHRRLRGPYTMAGTILRSLVPAALADDAAAITRYDIEVLAAAPELESIMPLARATLTSTAAVRERTRFYGADRTTQLANGMAELLVQYLDGRPPCSLVIFNVGQADPTDQELVAILLRRLPRDTLTLVIGTDDGPLIPALADALAAHATRHEAVEVPVEAARRGTETELAAAYVRSECLAEEPALVRAYTALDERTRARLHDSRAAELEAAGELSSRLGSIPFHRVRGEDPTGSGVEALSYAIDHCSLMGFYAATLELTEQARPLVHWDRPKLNHLVTARRALALIMTGRADEAEALYDEARLFTVDAEMHMMAAYSTAMLYTRHLDAADRDHRKAVAWINQAIAFASTYPEPANRAFQTVFMQNGLALIESHRGNLREALQLVEAGALRLNEELAPDAHLLHRSVLIHNSGQVRTALGDFEGAVADYSEAIRRDPHYAPYYFDRAGVLHRLGRDDEAVQDYDTAIAMSPPLPEAYYNRGDIRAAAGDIDGALADFGYVLQLTPGFVPAHLYRASLLWESDDTEGARRAVDAGLALEPDNAHLLSIRGQLHLADGDVMAAGAAFDRVTELDPSIVAAWAGRATIAFDRGDTENALADLGRALDIDDSCALRYNRAAILVADQRWNDALADLNRAADLDPSDPDVVDARERCLVELQTSAG